LSIKVGIMRQALAGACRPAQREVVLRETLRKLP
jgi:hypothetical protein